MRYKVQTTEGPLLCVGHIGQLYIIGQYCVCRCAQDKFLLNNLEYITDLMVEKEAHAFKFADRVVINFQCSVRLDVKDGECEV